VKVLLTVRSLPYAPRSKSARVRPVPPALFMNGSP